MCDKVLAANGNLTINFYCLLLYRFVNSELDASKEDFYCYDFLKFYSLYLDQAVEESHIFTEEAYQHYVDYFAFVDENEESINDQLLQELADLQTDVSEFIFGTITEGADLIEKLLIQLLGHENPKVRSSAIKYLNCIYDGNLWKLETPMTSEVRTTGDNLEIKFTPTIQSTSYYLALNFPSPWGTAISWHRVPRNAKIGEEIRFNLGKFEECGFYDYKIVRLNKESIENIEHHRIIVQNRFIKEANMHEIVVDLFKAEKNPLTGIIQARGSLRKVAKSLNYFEKKGIDTLYVAGVHKRAHDDPYSIASRTKIEESIGGEEDFKDVLIPSMHEKNMKIFVDLFDRVGSIHMSGKHRRLLMHHIDAKKIFTHFHGATGKSNFSYSSTSILNYRKKETWDILIKDAVDFVKKYGVDGLHLDNCHLWPTMKRIDKQEMYRKDVDGDPCYTSQDILNGEVIKSKEDHVLWTDCTECPNPLLFKLMKTLWSHFPELMVIGECWQENSEAVVELSGVVPRSNALVKNITDDILTFTDSIQADFENFKFNEEFLKDYCNGAILLQSSYLYSSKSPIKTFHKSYMTIIDTLFYHEVVPLTMHEEIDGIDSEIELYIQYFDPDYREMHASFHHRPIKEPFKELLAGDEETKEEEEINEEEINEEVYKKEFSHKISQRIEYARLLRKQKPCLRFGVNVPLKCVDSHGDVKTVLAYARYTDEQIGIIVSNFEDKEKTIWIDFLNLKSYLRQHILHETTIMKIEYWGEGVNNEFHLINEFLNCPHQFTIPAHDTLCFEVNIQGNSESHPEYYNEARANFIETLNRIHKANHLETSHIYSNYIKHLVECYHVHKKPDYDTSRLKGEENLIDFHRFVSQDPAVFNIMQEIAEKNIMGPIVFVTPELAPWFKIGGLAVMVDELARGFADLGEDTIVIVPFFQYKKGTYEEIQLDPNGEYGIKYLHNIEVTLGACHEVFGVHYGEVNRVKVYFIHHSVHFFEPYPGFDNPSRLRSCTLFSKAALQLL